jgi:hypothetical protein
VARKTLKPGKDTLKKESNRTITHIDAKVINKIFAN